MNSSLVLLIFISAVKFPDICNSIKFFSLSEKAYLYLPCMDCVHLLTNI